MVQYMSTELMKNDNNKNNCLVSNFYNKLKFPALFSVRNWWDFNCRNCSQGSCSYFDFSLECYYVFTPHFP